MAEAAQSVLRKITRPAGAFKPPALTPSRALRLACTRAAERSVGLSLSVLGISDDVMRLDALLAAMDEGLMLLALSDGSAFSGFAGLDLQARAAVIEVQAMGSLSSAAPPDRPPTAADAAMAEPFITRLLSELVTGTEGTILQGWADGHRVESRFANLREAGLNLADGDYRVVKLSLDLASGRQGLCVLVLPVSRGAPAVAEVAPAGPDFATRLRGTVMEAPARLTAVLHRMQVPLHLVEGFEVGQVLPLTGVTVSSVRIEGPDGCAIGRGRLGQMGGMRAVRIETPLPQDMTEMATGMGGGGGAMSLPGGLDMGGLDMGGLDGGGIGGLGMGGGPMDGMDLGGMELGGDAPAFDGGFGLPGEGFGLDQPGGLDGLPPLEGLDGFAPPGR